MKRFTVLASILGVSVLSGWVIFQASASSAAEAKNNNMPIQVEDTIVKDVVIPVTGVERNVAPVFDASGAVVSNPSGMVFDMFSSSDRKLAPVFDTTGAVVSDPSGILLSETHSSDRIVPVIGADRKVAPVFDTTGALVSDPTGTIWNAGNP